MSSGPTATVDPTFNSPWVNTVAGYVAHLQEQKFLTKERLKSLKNYFLFTIGFLVLIYFLIHIQILFYWLLKFLFGLIFKLISLIFWLPLRTVRWFVPKTVDYDILFPLFWLCSIASFYTAKHYHERICQFYDRQVVRRYRQLSYDSHKREEVRRYLFILTFVALLLLQSLFILFPIAQSIKHHHAEAKRPSVSPTATVQTPMAKSAVKEAVETMSENLYHRFVEAFKDENETISDGKRQPLISDEQLEKTFKMIRKSLGPHKKKVAEEAKVEKSSRFQRWVLHYLKAPFQKWPPPKEETDPTDSPGNQDEEEEDDDEEFSISSASLMTQIEDSDDDEDEEVEIDEDTEKHSIVPQPIQQGLNKLKNLGEKLKTKISSSDDDDDDDEEEDEDEDEHQTESSSIKETLARGVKQMKTLGEEVTKKFSSSKRDAEDEDEDEQVPSMGHRLKETVTKQMENLQHKAEKLIPTGKDEKKHAPKLTEKIEETVKKILPSESLTEKVKHSLDESVETVKHFGEKVAENLQERAKSFSSSQSTDDEDSGYESDNEGEDPSLLERLNKKIVQPASDAAHQLGEKISSFVESEEEQAKVLIDRTKHAAEKLAPVVKEKIVSEVDHLHHVAEDVLGSAQDAASDVYQKSTEFLKEKVSQIKEKLPATEKVLANVKHELVEPLEKKVKQTKKIVTKKAEEVAETIVTGVKSLKKKKKPKTLTEKAKDQMKKIGKTIREKLPGQKKKKKKTKKEKIVEFVREQGLKRLNGWTDDAWNVWHLTAKNIAHLFTPSTRHAQHLPRYNTTSIYTAYTDVKCYDYTKKRQLYRISKRPHLSFLDSYRAHSPFPVYLSVLKSNGPRCYRQYPDSSCGVALKATKRSFLTQLYRFLRFWIVLGIILAAGAALYQRFVEPAGRRRPSPGDSDRSSPRRVRITEPPAAPPRPSPPSAGPLDEQVHEQLRVWLNRQQNDGYQKLSETCRNAMNNTFLKQLERLSVETLQFINARISHVSQNNRPQPTNASKKNEIPADRLVINAVLEIDHLILNIINIFTEHHFSFETQKLTGQLYVLLVINPTQYAIEASVKELRLAPATIIDRTNKLSAEEKQSMARLIEESIQRTTVRCDFRLADNQENDTSIGSSSFDSNRMYSSSNQTTPPTPAGTTTKSSLQTTAATSLPRSRPITPTIYPPPESPPTLLINDHQVNLYNSGAQPSFEARQILIQIVKAVQLHNVEQPYCILELDHPKQIQQSSIARNGLNPFWDERFLFECDERTSQLRIQIIDRRYPNPKLPDGYVDTLYADLTIPFSYMANRVYKQDVQINPQYPESILRIGFSTLSEEEALAANNGYDVESLTDSQTWPYNDREAKSMEQEYGQRYPSSPSNDFLSSGFDSGTMPKPYGMATNIYDHEREYASTLPRSVGLHSPAPSYNPSSPLTPRDGTSGSEKPQKTKSFMHSLKHLTLPRRKHRKEKSNDESMSSQASSTSQLNVTVPAPTTNLASHNSSSEYFLSKTTDGTPIRRSRSISQSFKNLFRSSSRKRGKTAKTDALGDFNNGTQNILGDNRANYLATSTPTTKKLSFLSRRKSKSKTKQTMDMSTNSLSSYDHSSQSSMESVRDTPIRANGGQPVIMSKSVVR